MSTHFSQQKKIIFYVRAHKKVSKWKAVKAAFKWEKTNTLTLNESKSSDSVLSPSPNENTK